MNNFKEPFEDSGWSKEKSFRGIAKIRIDENKQGASVYLYKTVDKSKFDEVIQHVDRVEFRRLSIPKIYDQYWLRGEFLVFGRNLRVIKRQYLHKKGKPYYEIIVK